MENGEFFRGGKEKEGEKKCNSCSRMNLGSCSRNQFGRCETADVPGLQVMESRAKPNKEYVREMGFRDDSVIGILHCPRKKPFQDCFHHGVGTL